MQNYQDFKRQALRKRKIAQAYHELEPEFKLIECLIEARIHRGLTQQTLAQRIGTKQSAISRLERGQYNPTLGFLRKVAAGLNVTLTVTIK